MIYTVHQTGIAIILGGGEIVISPITIRYTKVLQDIFSLFNIREIKHIAEIGVGYGGQCRLIKEYLKNREYSLIDLPEAIELTKKFLDKFSLGEGSKTYFIDGTGDIENIEVDLLISNYAFSELNREVQNFYLEKIINYAGSGYITWNSLSYEKGDGYSVAELLDKIKGSFVIAENPLTDKDNCIIVWGTKRKKEHEGDAGVR